MSAPSAVDLLAPPSADEIESLMLAYVQLVVNPVTDWNSGAVQRTMMHIETAILTSLVGPGTPPAVQSAMAGLLANGYPDTAAGDSLATIAHGWFDVTKTPGAFAVQTVTLACATGAFGPYTFTAGLQEGLASDGFRYVAAGSGTLTAGSTLTLDFNARSVGLAKAMITQLAQAIPGVSVQSAAIKVSGGVPQFGADADSDTTIKAAIGGRFPVVGAVPTEDRLIKWALAAGTSTTRCRIDPDPDLPGGVFLTVANASGPVPFGELSPVLLYVRARLGITENVTVQNSSAVSVTAGGTVTVPAALLAQVQTAADVAWATYLSTVEIGTAVYLLALIKAVMDAGATNFVSPTLNSVGSDLALAATEVPAEAATLTASLTWVSA